MENNVATGGDNGRFSERLEQAQSEARECIENCALVAEVAEELVMQRHLGLQFTLWVSVFTKLVLSSSTNELIRSYANMCMLLITFQSPVFAYVPETQDDRYIRTVFRALHQWRDLKMVARSLRRAQGHMSRLGIPTDSNP
jgi:hypothetical protein